MPATLSQPTQKNDAGGGGSIQPPPTYQVLLTVDPNNMVLIGGTVRSSAEQKVEIVVRVDGEAAKTYALFGRGTRNAILTTPDDQPSITLYPIDKKMTAEFTFYHKSGSDWVVSKLNQNCFSPSEQFDRPKYIQLFYFCTEDWTDMDYNDSVVGVSVFADRE